MAVQVFFFLLLFICLTQKVVKLLHFDLGVILKHRRLSAHEGRGDNALLFSPFNLFHPVINQFKLLV